MKRLLIIALMIVAPLQAHAILITSSGGTFDITTSTVAGSDPLLTSQPWWGNSALALELAGLLNDDLGLPNPPDFLVFGPLFAFRTDAERVNIQFAAFGFGTASFGQRPVDEINTFAVVAAAAVPEPSSLVLFGAGVLAIVMLGRRRFTTR